MTTIDPYSRFETLDFDDIEAGLRRGRRLQARAMGSALKALFSRRAKDETDKRDGHLPDCAAAA